MVLLYRGSNLISQKKGYVSMSTVQLLTNLVRFLIPGRKLLVPATKNADFGSSFSNVCLSSKLSYISNLTKKVVFQQIQHHLSPNKLYSKLHSA